MGRGHPLELFSPEMAIQADKGRDFGIFPIGVGKVPDARFLLELFEFLDSLADERVRIFHVCISTCFELSAYIVNFPGGVNKPSRREKPLEGNVFFG